MREQDETPDFEDLNPSKMSASALEDILARANPALRAVLERLCGADSNDRLTNGTFNAFIESDL
ncbi:hypothetical protein [Streptomyces sp. NPDC057617]|uniref:hypothetical protein n=1 Tax=Streptomyces sp. NPDC057617 TaxID=3346184 RepID=UPI0036C40982